MFVRKNIIISVHVRECGFRNQWNHCGIRNQENPTSGIGKSWALEYPEYRLKESGIPRTIRVRNLSSTDIESKSSEWNP